jgi:hypothetical protein
MTLHTQAPLTLHTSFRFKPSQRRREEKGVSQVDSDLDGLLLTTLTGCKNFSPAQAYLLLKPQLQPLGANAMDMPGASADGL